MELQKIKNKMIYWINANGVRPIEDSINCWVQLQNCTAIKCTIPEQNEDRDQISELTYWTKKEVPVLKLLSIITSDTYVQLPPALELNIGLTLHPDPNTFRDFEKQSL